MFALGVNLEHRAIFRFIANGHLKFCRREPQGVSRGVAFVEGRIRIRSRSRRRRRNAGKLLQPGGSHSHSLEVHKDSPSSPFTLCPSCQSQLSLYLILCPSIKLPQKCTLVKTCEKLTKKLKLLNYWLGQCFVSCP